jgi:hypothetical protein
MDMNTLLMTIKNANLALAFFMELGVLVALGYWGFHTGAGIITRIILGIGIPVIAIVVWGILGAPNSAWQLQGLWFLALSVVWFGSAALGLFVAGQRKLGIAFALFFVINQALVYALGK